MDKDQDRRIKRVEDRFDKFQEAYIANGKELVRVAESMEELTRAVGTQHEAFEVYKKSNAEALEWVKHMKWGRKALVGTVSLIATIIGIVLAVKANFFG